MAKNGTGPWIGMKATGTILIQPGESCVRHRYVARNTAGTYSVTFKADPDNVDPGAVVQESNESNNERSFKYTLR